MIRCSNGVPTYTYRATSRFSLADGETPRYCTFGHKSSCTPRVMACRTTKTFRLDLVLAIPFSVSKIRKLLFGYAKVVQGGKVGGEHSNSFINLFMV